MTFDDYMLKQDHIVIRYHAYSGKPYKRVITLDGLDLKDVKFIEYYKYDAKKDDLLHHRIDGPAFFIYDSGGTLQFKYFWINGNFHSKEDYLSLGGKL